jgi:hypothetical protein
MMWGRGFSHPLLIEIVDLKTTVKMWVRTKGSPADVDATDEIWCSPEEQRSSAAE